MFPQKIKRYAVPAILLVLLFISLSLLANFLIQQRWVQFVLINKLGAATGYHLLTERIELYLWKGIGINVYGLEAKSWVRRESIMASKVRIILDARKIFKGEIAPVRIDLYEALIELEKLAIPNILKSKETEDQRISPIIWISGVRSFSMERGQILVSKRPFDLRALDLHVQRKSANSMTFKINLKGDLDYGGEIIPFRLRGALNGDKGVPYGDVELETGKVPLKWVPWPEAIVMRRGDFKASLNLKGHPARGMNVSGEISTDTFRFSLIQPNLRKDYSVASMIINFKSSLEGRRLSFPVLKLNTPDVSLAISLHLDFINSYNPYLEMEVKGPFMDLGTFKNLFPTPLLASWVEKRLFPILRKGDARLDRLSLKGSLNQFKNLSSPPNQSALSLSVDCKNFQVLSDKIKHPFENVSANVIFKNGELHISKLKTQFGSSVIKEGSLHVEGLLNKSKVYQASVNGSFEIRELMQQKGMDPVPPDIIRKLEQMGSISGRLACGARFRYESG